MKKIIFHIVLCLVAGPFCISHAQVGTYLFSCDPAPDNPYQTDKGKDIIAIDSFVFMVNGFINEEDNREGGQILKINANTHQIVKEISILGPQGDISIASEGGYSVTKNNEILFTGEWYDYNEERMKAFLCKIDKDLTINWIHFYNDLSEFNVFAYGVAQDVDGSILFSMVDHISEDPYLINLQVVKADSLGNVIWNKIIPDTFPAIGPFGDLTRTDDGYFILTASTVDFQYDPGNPWNSIVHKINDNGDLIWSRIMDYSTASSQVGLNTSLFGGDMAVVFRTDTSWYDWITVDDEFPVLYRLDTNGNQKWRYEWYEPCVHYVYRIITAKNGDILGLGFYQRSGKGRTWMFRCSPEGEMIWDRLYSDSIQRPWSPQLEMLDLCEMDDGRIAATGIVWDTNSIGDINVNMGLLVVDSNGCVSPDCDDRLQYIAHISEPFNNKDRISELICSPNPAKNSFYVQPSNNFGNLSGKLEIQCYDSQGKLIDSFQLENLDRIEIQSSGWPPGIFNIVLYRNGIPIASGKVLIWQ